MESKGKEWWVKLYNNLIKISKATFCLSWLRCSQCTVNNSQYSLCTSPTTGPVQSTHYLCAIRQFLYPRSHSFVPHAHFLLPDIIILNHFPDVCIMVLLYIWWVVVVLVDPSAHSAVPHHHICPSTPTPQFFFKCQIRLLYSDHFHSVRYTYIYLDREYNTNVFENYQKARRIWIHALTLTHIYTHTTRQDRPLPAKSTINHPFL